MDYDFIVFRTVGNSLHYCWSGLAFAYNRWYFVNGAQFL